MRLLLAGALLFISVGAANADCKFPLDMSSCFADAGDSATDLVDKAVGGLNDAGNWVIDRAPESASTGFVAVYKVKPGTYCPEGLEYSHRLGRCYYITVQPRATDQECGEVRWEDEYGGQCLHLASSAYGRNCPTGYKFSTRLDRCYLITAKREKNCGRTMYDSKYQQCLYTARAYVVE